ncbi:hypothetical protein [Hymenobacter wooponensis]|uniref:hypothetical protein n=1 Tax=Hymenobacter wooponensis TaxID=1525360 RepID=UPI00143690CB|nr:hypothetical protein [Hymenobacter wooponensis]
MSSSPPASPSHELPHWLPADEMLHSVLDVSLNGLIFSQPVYDQGVRIKTKTLS